MAGRGPVPKREDQRRNRSKPKADELGDGGGHDGIPPLPKKYRRAFWVADEGRHETQEFAYLQATRRWYVAWARSPLASEMTEVHWLRLQEIAQIKDRWERTGDLELAKELRLQLAAFGGTPADMRRMNVTLPKKPKAAPAPAAAPERPAAGPAGGRRLRVVDPALAAEG